MAPSLSQHVNVLLLVSSFKDPLIDSAITPCIRFRNTDTKMEQNQTTRLALDVPLAASGNNGSVGEAFVGSPDQINFSEGSLPARPLSSLENANRRRPSLDRRSFSSPHAPQLHSTRLSTTPRSLRITSTSRRPISGRASPGEHQWTLFGQVMENELRSSAPRRIKKHPSNVVPPSESRSGYFPTPPGLSDTESRVQSPLGNFPPGRDDNMSEDEYDSDESQPSQTTFVEHTPRWYSVLCLPTLSNLQRNITKCVIAYFIASLFTFSPYLSSFVSDITSDNEPGNSRPSPAGHMVATV
jgi:hypothetical protein